MLLQRLRMPVYMLCLMLLRRFCMPVLLMLKQLTRIVFTRGSQLSQIMLTRRRALASCPARPTTRKHVYKMLEKTLSIQNLKTHTLVANTFYTKPPKSTRLSKTCRSQPTPLVASITKFGKEARSCSDRYSKAGGGHNTC